MNQNLISKNMVAAVNKIASENGKLANPEYAMRHIPDEWLIFERKEWCYIPLREGISKINDTISMELTHYGLSRPEINSYKELLLLLDIPWNPLANSKTKNTKKKGKDKKK